MPPEIQSQTKAQTQTNPGFFATAANFIGRKWDQFKSNLPNTLSKDYKRQAAEFIQTIGNTNSTNGQGIIETPDGGLAIAGSTGTDALLIKVSAQGTPEWTLTVPGPTPNIAYGEAVAVQGDNYIMAGYATDTNNLQKGMIVICDKTGVFKSAQLVGGENTSEQVFDIIATPDGGYAITGQTGDQGGTDVKSFVTKFKLDGSIDWTTIYGEGNNNRGVALALNAQGNIEVAGRTVTAAGDQNTVTAEFNNAGALVSYRNMDIGGQQTDDVPTGIDSQNGTTTLVGTVVQGGNYTPYIVQLPSSGNTTVFAKTVSSSTLGNQIIFSNVAVLPNGIKVVGTAFPDVGPSKGLQITLDTQGQVGPVSVLGDNNNAVQLNAIAPNNIVVGGTSNINGTSIILATDPPPSCAEVQNAVNVTVSDLIPSINSTIPTFNNGTFANAGNFTVVPIVNPGNSTANFISKQVCYAPPATTMQFTTSGILSSTGAAITSGAAATTTSILTTLFSTNGSSTDGLSTTGTTHAKPSIPNESFPSWGWGLLAVGIGALGGTLLYVVYLSFCRGRQRAQNNGMQAPILADVELESGANSVRGKVRDKDRARTGDQQAGEALALGYVPLPLPDSIQSQYSFDTFTDDNGTEFILLPDILGEGAFGTVRLGRVVTTKVAEVNAGDFIAVKITDPQNKAQAMLEATAQKSLDDLFSVNRIIGTASEKLLNGGLCFMQLSALAPYGDASRLAKKIAEARNLDDHDKALLVRWFLAHALDAVTLLHNRNRAHLDIRLANFLIGKEFAIKLNDFDRSRFSTSGTHLLENVPLGICYNWSPEGAEYYREKNKSPNKTVTIDGYAYDSWTLGMAGVEMLLGEFPWGNDVKNAAKGSDKVMNNWNDEFYHKQLKDLESKLEQKLDKDSKLKETLMGLLNFDPQQRFSINQAASTLNSQPLSDDEKARIKELLTGFYVPSNSNKQELADDLSAPPLSFKF